MAVAVRWWTVPVIAVAVLLAVLLIGVAVLPLWFVCWPRRRPVPEVFVASCRSPLVFLPFLFRWIAVVGGPLLSLGGGGGGSRPLVDGRLPRFASFEVLVRIQQVAGQLVVRVEVCMDWVHGPVSPYCLLLGHLVLFAWPHLAVGTQCNNAPQSLYRNVK
jgi:hypothetical protein